MTKSDGATPRERRLMAKDAAGNWIGYGPGDSSPEVARIEHRMLAAYPTNSHAHELGVREDQLYTEETAAAVKELAEFVNEIRCCWSAWRAASGGPGRGSRCGGLGVSQGDRRLHPAGCRDPAWAPIEVPDPGGVG